MSAAPFYILDGYSLIYKSYFAFIKAPLYNKKNENTSALFGFFRTLFSFFTQYKPLYFAVAMDSIGPTFRHEQYPEYKATRDKTPEDLQAQIPRIEKILEIIGVKVIRINGFEADDIIATFAKKCVAEKRKYFIITGDKDLMQLVSEYTGILKPGKTGYEELGREEVFAQYGVYPHQIVDYLSLTGDNADNIPGVSGIGPKNASALLEKYENIEGIYNSLDKMTGSIKTKLENGRESCKISRDLVVLKDDVKLDDLIENFIDDFSTNNYSYVNAAPFFEAENAKSLAAWILQQDVATCAAARTPQFGAGQLQLSAGQQIAGRQQDAGPLFDNSEEDASPSASIQTADVQNKPDTGMFFESKGIAEDIEKYFSEDEIKVLKGKGSYTAITDLNSLDSLIKEIKEKKIFSFDVETDGLDTFTSNPVGFSIALESGSAYYIPLRADNKEILPESLVKNRLRLILEDKSLKLIGQNIKFDYKVLCKWGIKPTNIWFDTMIAAWLLNTRLGSFSMDYLAEYYLDYKTISYKEVMQSAECGVRASTFDLIPLETAVEYSGEDADITYRLYTIFSKQLKEKEMESLFYDLEMPVVVILSDMELEGVRIRREILESYGKELGKKIAELEKEIYKLCGKEFNISSTKQLQEVLFTERQLKTVKKTKTGYSTDNYVLEELAKEDPVPALVLKYRTYSKLKSTYADALPQLSEASTYKIHTTYRQTGTATGRLSSINPNLQNIPIKDEDGKKIRKAFVPSAGRIFMSADYSQIELVVFAHLSEDPELIRAFAEKTDVHTLTASLIFGIAQEEVTPEQRRIAKTINFGVMYGMSSFRLSKELQIPRVKAEDFINSYFNRYGKIRDFIDKTVKYAEENGYVKTILGRRRYIDGINSKNKNEKSGAERMAVNTPIQGSAADIVKQAMINVTSRIKKDGLNSKLVLQVHDELIFEVPFNENEVMKNILREEMESVIKLKAPLKVFIETGESWGDMY
ncbi:MAG: DNA polymerase I [Spirochaetes bacterium]|nr:DNA polymerase I [Spirochaetota bacterium]